MGTIEIKRELHNLIDEGDDKFVKMFYEMAKAYIGQKRKDKMISEGEEDIKEGRLYSLKEARELWINGKQNKCSINI
ncbi:hypothetical protein E5F92_000025 [Flavobacterium columnare]|uniref:hypothetical protein n=1 Tax=Flavobacterium columnare TaxID=996 RepID=UPI002989C43C|nr:hypothetical protein [Flavobacterium columnare]MCH4831143.1 hypothetical protein [Flavobacterium columnare]